MISCAWPVCRIHLNGVSFIYLSRCYCCCCCCSCWCSNCSRHQCKRVAITTSLQIFYCIKWTGSNMKNTSISLTRFINLIGWSLWYTPNKWMLHKVTFQVIRCECHCRCMRTANFMPFPKNLFTNSCFAVNFYGYLHGTSSYESVIPDCRRAVLKRLNEVQKNQNKKINADIADAFMIHYFRQ